MSFRFNANKIKLTFIPLQYKNIRKVEKRDVTELRVQRGEAAGESQF